MKRKFLIGFLVLFMVVSLAWGFNVAFRVTQFVCQELNPDWRMNQVEAVDGCQGSGIGDLSSFVAGTRRGINGSITDSFPVNQDADADGLNALEEIFRLTSDQSPDSDSDGIPDKEDTCIDCRVLSYRDRLETLLVSRMFCHWASGRDRVYVLSTHSVDPSAECPETTFVSAPSWAVEILLLQPEAWGSERNPDWGMLRIEPRLYVPGLVYGYYVDYYCGPLCAETSYAFILDLPIHGPVYLGRRVLWVS